MHPPERKQNKLQQSEKIGGGGGKRTQDHTKIGPKILVISKFQDVTVENHDGSELNQTIAEHKAEHSERGDDATTTFKKYICNLCIGGLLEDIEFDDIECTEQMFPPPRNSPNRKVEEQPMNHLCMRKKNEEEKQTLTAPM